MSRCRSLDHEALEPPRLMRLVIAVAVDAGRLEMFDDVFERWQPDRDTSADEREKVATVRAGIAAGAAQRLDALRTYAISEFGVEAEDLLEGLGVPAPELRRRESE